MLNPQNPLHIRLGRILFRLPHNQRRWRHYLGLYFPILNPAFQHNEAARLLVMKLLKQLERNELKQAATTIRVLIPYVREAEQADKVLFSFLRGLADAKAGDHDNAAKRFRWANKFNHRYFLPYMLAAENDADNLLRFPEAAQGYQTSIDCIYEYPPLNDITKQFLCLAYAELAFTHVMMHQYDDAKADLLHAEQMGSENAPILRAKAYLYAARRQSAEARACVEKFSQYDTDKHTELKEKVESILAEKDLHFTQQPIGSPEGITAFWENFLAREDELRRLAGARCTRETYSILRDLLKEMDHYQETDYAIGIDWKDGEYVLIFRCCYSRTYTPFVNDLLAACPDAVRKRWRIICDP